MQAEPVVDDDQAAREEEVGDQRDPARVRGDDGRPPRGRVVEPGVRRPGPTVDDPAGAEPVAGARGGDRRREASPPEPLAGDRAEDRTQLRLLRVGPAGRLGVEIHHRRRQREPLHGEAAGTDDEAARQRARLTRPVEHGDLPGVAAGAGLEVDGGQRGGQSRVGKELERMTGDRALERRSVVDALDDHEADVARTEGRRREGHPDPGRGRRRQRQHEPQHARSRRPRPHVPPAVSRAAAGGGTARSRP